MESERQQNDVSTALWKRSAGRLQACCEIAAGSGKLLVRALPRDPKSTLYASRGALHELLC